MQEDRSESTKQEPSFEKSLERLEYLVRTMENGSLSLEKMIDNFVEGSALVKFCNEKLNEVERKIEMLVKKGNSVVTEPFNAKSNDQQETAS